MSQQTEITFRSIRPFTLGVVHISSIDDEIAEGPFQRLLLEEVSAAPDRPLVLDFCAVKFGGSKMISALLVAAKMLRRHGHRLAIVKPEKHIRTIFQVMGIPQIIAIHETLDEAVAAMEKGPDEP